MPEPELVVEDDGNGEATTRIQPVEVMATLEEATEGTTVVQRRADPPRVSWVQRLLNWFREECCIFRKG